MKQISIPATFAADHEDRDLEMPHVIRRGKRTYRILLDADSAEASELMSDACSYGDPDSGFCAETRQQLERSARRTVEILLDAGVPLPHDESGRIHNFAEWAINLL